MRLRISELLLFTAFVAGAFACMRNPMNFTASIYVSVVLLTLMISMVMAIAVQKQARVFWICFAACGFVSSYSSDLTMNSEWSEARDYSIISPFVEELFDRVHEDRFPPATRRGGGGIFNIESDVYATGARNQIGGGGLGGGGLGGGGQATVGYEEAHGSFLLVTHALIAICLAWLGGHFGSLVQKRTGTTKN